MKKIVEKPKTKQDSFLKRLVIGNNELTDKTEIGKKIN